MHISLPGSNNGRQHTERRDLRTDLDDNFNMRHHAQENGLTAWPQGQISKEMNMMNNNKKSRKKNPTCNASASTNEGEGDRHLAVRTRAEKRQK